MTNRTLVVKVGTSLLRGKGGQTTTEFVNQLAETLCRERQRGTNIALVTSGAVGLGCKELGLKQRPEQVEELQAAAAIGQGQLMGLYDKAFKPHDQIVAQVLLTRSDLASRRRFLKASLTLQQLLSWGVLPIVNENDTLATEELRFGDNDTLSALVAVAVKADELILLTDVDRLYSADPREDENARPIKVVRSLQELEELRSVAGDGGRWGTGGMTTKLSAARIATASGIAVRLADGRDPSVLQELLQGSSHGTQFLPSPQPIPDRKSWLAHALVPQGTLQVDAGAEQALLEEGASLLAVGVSELNGEFEAQAPLKILSDEGQELARGLSTCDSETLRRIIGMRSGTISRTIDNDLNGVVVHRDQLVITAPPEGPTISPPSH